MLKICWCVELSGSFRSLPSVGVISGHLSCCSGDSTAPAARGFYFLPLLERPQAALAAVGSFPVEAAAAEDCSGEYLLPRFFLSAFGTLLLADFYACMFSFTAVKHSYDGSMFSGCYGSISGDLCCRQPPWPWWQ